MAERGGYQRPRNPAPVSGPGRLSRRTDSGPQAKRRLPDAAYGEQAEFQSVQGGAPMAGTGPTLDGPQPSPQGGPGGSPVELIPMGAPTQNPDMPVTAGADVGEGPGLASMGLIPREQQITQQDLARLQAYLPFFEWIANLPGASEGARDYVRQLKALIP